MIIGRQFAEKLYSENEAQEERLYSTGDPELDDLLERAFCEGYEYAQREFGNPQNKAAKRAYEAGLGKRNEYTIMSAASKLVGHPKKYKTMDDALVNVGRTVQGGKRTPTPGFGEKIKGIDQKINVRGKMNTNNNPYSAGVGRPYDPKTGSWKGTSQFIKAMS